MDGNGPAQSRVNKWPEDMSPAADSVPLRLADGFHALVLTGRDPGLQAVYPSKGSGTDETTLLAAL